ncbi:MAG: hypothetical protein PHC83_05300 [Bacteroidales bacterium]|nr:hypothetical protein [Bacteroidales bacterium]MDD4208730.1 hypothetical protein [Bacteroidales bacterium]
MDAKFSFIRVKSLLNRYFIENWKIDLILGLIIFLLTLISRSHQTPLFVFSFLVIVYSFKLFAVNLSVLQRTHFLMIPASIFEKLSVNAILIHVYYPLILLVFFFIGIVCRGIIVSFFIDKFDIVLESMYQCKNMINSIPVLSLLSIQAVVMFGSIYFMKSPFFKTLLSVIVFFLFLLSVVLFVFYKNLENNAMLTVLITEEFLSKINEIRNYVLIFIKLSILFYFWILSYFRLKEMEV